MPNWIGPLLALLALTGFIGFAFRQGTRVKPDKHNPDNWQSGEDRPAPTGTPDIRRVGRPA
jgi:hypothetical protein